MTPAIGPAAPDPTPSPTPPAGVARGARIVFEPLLPNHPQLGGQDVIYADFGDGAGERAVLQYYPDEVRFTPDEVNGRTANEIRQLFVQKDTAYLRS